MRVPTLRGEEMLTAINDRQIGIYFHLWVLKRCFEMVLTDFVRQLRYSSSLMASSPAKHISINQTHLKARIWQLFFFGIDGVGPYPKHADLAQADFPSGYLIIFVNKPPTINTTLIRCHSIRLSFDIILIEFTPRQQHYTKCVFLPHRL